LLARIQTGTWDSVFVRPQSTRRPIKDRVDELVRVRSTEALRQADGLINGYAVGHLGSRRQFVEPDQKSCMLHRIQLRGGAVHHFSQLSIERFAGAPHSLNEHAE